MENKKSFLNYIKSFNAFELIWLIGVLLLLTIFSIAMPDLMFEDTSNTLMIICSIVSVVANPVCELLISKQNKYNFIVSILFIEITEMIIYFSLHLYSCALVSLLFWVPIDIASFIKWNKNPDTTDETVTKVKKLSWWQDILIIYGIMVFSVAVGYLLTFIPECEDTYLDAFVSAVGMTNGILLLLRYNEQWYAWFTYLIFDAILWIISGHYVMLITIAAMLINTIYGFFKWLKYIKDQKKQTTE